MSQNSGPLAREVISETLREILEAMTEEWDRDPETAIGEGTQLVRDLGFESIDVVQFIVAIEERFRRRGLPYEEFLMIDGRYVDEIILKDVVDFLHRHLNS